MYWMMFSCSCCTHRPMTVHWCRKYDLVPLADKFLWSFNEGMYDSNTLRVRYRNRWGWKVWVGVVERCSVQSSGGNVDDRSLKLTISLPVNLKYDDEWEYRYDTRFWSLVNGCEGNDELSMTRTEWWCSLAVWYTVWWWYHTV